MPAHAAEFLARLGDPRPDATDRRWVWVPYDQLTAHAGPLADAPPRELGIVLVENRFKARRRPYHKQKLALVLASQRHFALEQSKRGVAVRYVFGDAPYRDLLADVVDDVGPLVAMEPAERELRRDVAPLVEQGAIEIVPHAGWLTTREQFLRHAKTPPWRMDAFYRLVRRESGVLMDAGGKPVGGRFSFDGENRESWPGDPPAAEPPRFRADEVTEEVCALVEDLFADHPGRLDAGALPASEAQVERFWQWALDECLEHFGPFEDAMSTRSRNLFHTRISPLLNLCRLLPRRVVDDVLARDVPLSSKEGFVRQVLGWREFVRHVHVATDGFRSLPGARSRPTVRRKPGDAGWGRWLGRDLEPSDAKGLDGGAAPSALDAHRPLPKTFWGAKSGLHCLDRVVDGVLDEAYGHHITRLMVLSNLATLLDVEPRELCDWFWVAYADAYDWVVEPNVLGMGTFAVGDLFTTKPYVSGAAYIHRMSDYCNACAFDPKKSCPITSLYWAFLARHRDAFADNQRMSLPLATLGKRKAKDRERDARVFDIVADAMAHGRAIEPDDLP